MIKEISYLERFRGKTFVIKYGGAAMVNETQMKNIMQEIVLLHAAGIKIVLVHGGGPSVTHFCERLNIKTRFMNGLRVTDAATMEIVQMVLFGKINRTLITTLNQFGVKAVGLTGQDATLIQAKKHANEIDLGYVGEVSAINTALMDILMNANFLPVITPIGFDGKGQSYNINADLVAGALAGALHAEKLIILSDVDGLYQDLNDKSTKIDVIKKQAASALIKKKCVSGGMIPKLQSCLYALEQGVLEVRILDGTAKRHILLDMFKGKQLGTVITA